MFADNFGAICEKSVDRIFEPLGSVLHKTEERVDLDWREAVERSWTRTCVHFRRALESLAKTGALTPQW